LYKANITNYQLFTSVKT